MKPNTNFTVFLLALVLAVGLTGCWFGCDEDADLIVSNQSSQIVGRVEIYLSQESTCAIGAKEGTGLKNGETWGFSMPEQADTVVIKVFDLRGTSLALGRCSWPGHGKRLWAFYDGSNALHFQWEAEE